MEDSGVIYTQAIKAAMGLARRNGSAPVRLWLTEADWKSLNIEVTKNSHLTFAIRIFGLPISLCGDDEQSRVVGEDGQAFHINPHQEKPPQ